MWKEACSILQGLMITTESTSINQGTDGFTGNGRRMQNNFTLPVILITGTETHTNSKETRTLTGKYFFPTKSIRIVSFMVAKLKCTCRPATGTWIEYRRI